MLYRRGFPIRSFFEKKIKISIRGAFTLVELTVALIVVTLVVMVTLPITLSKMKKVDYASYYIGYNTVKDMATNILQAVLDAELDEPASACLYEKLDYCIKEPAFIPTPVSKSECESLKSMYGSIIGGCYYDQDYYAGAVKACNGSLPGSMFMSWVYYMVENKTDTETLKKLQLLNPIKFVSICSDGSGIEYDCPKSYPAFWIDWTSLLGSQKAPVYTSGTGSGAGTTARRNNSSAYAVCAIPTSSMEPDDSDGEVLDTYNKVLCDKIKRQYNIDSSDCSITPESVQSKVAAETFAGLTPNIVFSNGLMMYIGSDLEDIADLSDAESADDRKGFVVYIDVNGSSGNGKLWQDVFPFYLLKSGKVLPAYDDDLIAGANNTENLSVNVLYDNYSGDNREIKLLLSDANFRSAACVTGYIKSAKYCDGKEQYNLCKKDYHDCRMVVKEPVKLF